MRNHSWLLLLFIAIVQCKEDKQMLTAIKFKKVISPSNKTFLRLEADSTFYFSHYPGNFTVEKEYGIWKKRDSLLILTKGIEIDESIDVQFKSGDSDTLAIVIDQSLAQVLHRPSLNLFDSVTIALNAGSNLINKRSFYTPYVRDTLLLSWEDFNQNFIMDTKFVSGRYYTSLFNMMPTASVTINSKQGKSIESATLKDFATFRLKKNLIICDQCPKHLNIDTLFLF